MAATSYVPGTWLGVVRSRMAVLLGPETAPALADALWNLLADGPAAHEVLHAVTSSSGGSLASIPSFGILDFAGPLRVFLRGELELTVDLPDGPVQLNGRDVTTWNERRFATPGLCTLALPDAGAAGQPELPLGEGVVLLRSLTLGLHTGQAAVGAAPAAAVAVDSAGIAGVDQPGTGPELTVAPEPEVSAETVFAVIDDEPGLDDAVATEPGPALDDSATVDPALTGAAPANDLTSSYDHLWERTVMRNIEDAAVREDPEADLTEQGNARASVPEQPAPPAAPGSPAGDAEVPRTAAMPAASGSGDAPGNVLPDGPGHNRTSSAARPAPAGGLIDSIPWRTGGPASEAAPPAAAAAVTPPSDIPAARLEALPPAPLAQHGQTPGSPGAGDFDGDHDGQTVMKSSLAGMPARPAPAAPVDPADGPLVLARVCAQDHPNPPTRAHCAACGAALLPDAVQVARPRLGRMRVSTGELLDLDESLVIGRQPSVSRVQGGVMPRLVQVASPGGDISRSHVEVRLEGWHVMLCDLKATNGTVLVRDGQPPRRLAQNEMAILLDGDIAELGDNISLRFEEIP